MRVQGSYTEVAGAQPEAIASSAAIAASAAVAVAPAQSDDRSEASVPSSAFKAADLGTEEFAAACRANDRRPLGYRVAKRAFDIAFSAVVIGVGLIPCALLSVAIAVDTKGGPVYTQERIGRLGRPFRIYKFRSMVADADDVEEYLSAEQLDEWNCERKVTDDPRITELGRFIRKTSLDELPQFVNVLLGQMSVVGPRAVTRGELSHYGKNATLLLSVPQGITGAWQAGQRNGATFETGERQQIELGYARCANAREDLRVLLSTFGAMFGKRKTGR